MLKVTLIGDSIRMGYQPLVTCLLSGRTEVWGPEENGGDSRNVLANLETWAVNRPADVIQLNCGLHDIKVKSDGSHQVPLAEFTDKLGAIVGRLCRETSARLVWATITPVVEDRHRRSRDFGRFNADIQAYNAEALKIVAEAGLAVTDLHAVIVGNDPSRCICQDGVHMTDLGNRLLAEAVVTGLGL